MHVQNHGPKHSQLLQSFDTLSLTSDKKKFVVPTKEEWTQNDEVVEYKSYPPSPYSVGGTTIEGVGV